MRPDPAGQHSGAMTSSPLWTATRWGAAGLAGGALLGVLLVLPLRPATDEGFARLGWLLLVLGAAALLALVGGALAVHRGLRRAGDPLALRTALLLVPVAVLLGAVTAGAGALAAPAVARWLAGGLGRTTGWGPPPTGLAQRLVVTAVACLLLLAWALPEAGHALGGRVGGALLTWVAVLPAVVLPPLLLLRGRVPWPALAAGTTAAAALVGLAVPQAVAGARPTPARLEQVTDDLGPGAVSTQVRRVRDREVAISTLRAGGDVERWQQALRRDGWREVSPARAQVHFLPEDVRRQVQGRPQWARGLWLRASVVPDGDGVRVVVTVRP